MGTIPLVNFIDEDQSTFQGRFQTDDHLHLMFMMLLNMTNRPFRFKAIHGTKCYKLYDFVKNHNHPLIDENNLDNLKARRKLDFSDKVFIHHASLSNIGPTKAHRLRVAFMGGYHKVRGKAIDWKNFRRSLNKYIGPRDAQMLVDKLNDRKKHVPNFSFEYKTVNGELFRMFWVDETMKCNYIAFGDVVSFDATYRTNRYRMIFVPFTGIDHNQKSVTFGAGLLSDETFHSYTWLLTAFKQAHGKEPLMAVTDQDAALRNAIEFVFPESHHRLCMWHITQKLPGKICGDVENDSEFKKLFHKLIWNVHIGPEEFEQRWHALIGMFNLSANSWLSEMFEIRDRWIPGYFKDLPMCCLMKTTSRSESSNAFFRIHSHQGNMLVQFMLCFEAAMEKQRYTQRIADNRTFESTPVMFTALAIERFACQVYSRSIFREVVINELDGSITCSCNHFGRHGYLCRHVFCILHINFIDTIPERYISKRWRKDVIPRHLLEKRHRYGPCIEETDQLASDIHTTIEYCVNRLRNDTEKLTEFLAKVNELKKNLDDELPPEPQKSNNEDIFQKLLGVTTPNEVVVKVPKGIRNKGCGTGGARFIGPGEKAKNKAKTKQQGRSCSICFETGHNMRTCKRNKSKGKEIVAEESEDEEQAYDNDTSDHATSDTE
ncbi:FAR1-related sequence 5-like protein [Tanacetum coccineum]